MKVETDVFIRDGDSIRGEIDGDGYLTIRVGAFPRGRSHPIGASLTLFVYSEQAPQIADDLEALAKIARAAADARKPSGDVEAKPTGGAQ